MDQEFTVVLIKQKSSYLARCMELGIACQGATEAEALEGLREAVEAWLEGVREINRRPPLSAPARKPEIRLSVEKR